MPLFELASAELRSVNSSTFTRLDLLERQIQKAIAGNINAITAGVNTMVIAEEYSNWVDANRRIDLLCLDERGHLVVVELKRDTGAHMELQALRYAAMVSPLLFEHVVEAHRQYLISKGSTEDPAQVIRDFLKVDEGVPAISDKVRIVLASAEFSTEITTAVLWLNKQGLDIRCVQMRPHAIDQRVLIDFQQIIPLPQAAQYQVALREKSMEQDTARTSIKSARSFDLSIGEKTFSNLPRARLIYEVVAEALRRGMTPANIKSAAPWRPTLFLSAEGTLNEAQFLEAVGPSKLSCFTSDEDLFHIDGATYAFTTSWSGRTLTAVNNIINSIPAGEKIEYGESPADTESVDYGPYVIKRRVDGAIELEHDGVAVPIVLPVLRTLAAQLGLAVVHASGNEVNTRQLGAQVMTAIRNL